MPKQPVIIRKRKLEQQTTFWFSLIYFAWFYNCSFVGNSWRSHTGILRRKWATILRVSKQPPDTEWASADEEFQAFFGWEPHLWTMAIREQPFSLFLFSGHDYEKRTLRDNGACIPCLAPIHKEGTVGFPAAAQVPLIRGCRDAVLRGFQPGYHENRVSLVRQNTGGALSGRWE